MLNVVLLGRIPQVVTAIYTARTTTGFLTTAPERIPQMMKMKKATITRLIDNLLDTANQDAETIYMLRKHVEDLQNEIAKLELKFKGELNVWAKAYDKQTFELCEANKKIKELSAKNKKEVKKDG
jgi:hypothetical protein